MRAGAGKLHVVTVESIAVAVGLAMPEAMVSGVTEAPGVGFASAAVKDIAQRAKEVDAIVAGPGMAENATCKKIASTLIGCSAQLALDAALLKSSPEPGKSRTPMPVLLAHPGELAALLDCSEREVLNDPSDCGCAPPESIIRLCL